jgi:hypothetical protein
MCVSAMHEEAVLCHAQNQAQICQKRGEAASGSLGGLPKRFTGSRMLFLVQKFLILMLM